MAAKDVSMTKVTLPSDECVPVVEPNQYQYANPSVGKIKRVRATSIGAAYLNDDGIVGLYYSNNGALLELKEQIFSLPDLFADRGINYKGRIHTVFSDEDQGWTDDIVLSPHHCIVVSLGDTGGSRENYVTVFTRGLREDDLIGQQWHVTDIFRLEDDISFGAVHDLAIYERGNVRHFLVLGEGAENPTFFWGTKAIVYSIAGDSPAGIQMQEKWDWPCNHPLDVRTLTSVNSLPAFAILSDDLGEPEHSYHHPNVEFCIGDDKHVINIVAPKPGDLSDYSTIAKTEVVGSGFSGDLSTCGPKIFVTSRNEDGKQTTAVLAFEPATGFTNFGSYDPNTFCSIIENDQAAKVPFLLGAGQVIVQPYVSGNTSKLRLLVNQDSDYLTAAYSSLNDIQVSDDQSSEFIYDTDGARLAAYSPEQSLIKIIDLYEMMFVGRTGGGGRTKAGTSDFKIIVSPAGQENGDVSVYPNPSNSIIEITGVQGYSQVSITSVSGSVLQTMAVTSNSMRFDISSLPNGFYLVNCKHRTAKNKILRIVKN